MKKKIWGFSETSKGKWNTSNIGDYLAFYVTSPVKKVIGFGRLKRKFIDDTPIWPDELLFRRTIWRYRFEFEKFFVIDNWNEGIPIVASLMLNTGRRVIDKKTFIGLLRNAGLKWHRQFQSELEFVSEEPHQ